MLQYAFFSSGTHQTQTLSAPPWRPQTGKITPDCTTWSRVAAQLRSVQILPPWQHFKIRRSQCERMPTKVKEVHRSLHFWGENMSDQFSAENWSVFDGAMLTQLFGHRILVWISRNSYSYVGEITILNTHFLAVTWWLGRSRSRNRRSNSINTNIPHPQTDAETIGSRRTRGGIIQRALTDRRVWMSKVPDEMTWAMQSKTITHELLPSWANTG